jgi:hypothetical protein
VQETGGNPRHNLLGETQTILSSPPLNCSNNIVYDDAEKAEAFNTVFSSQSNIDDTDKSVPADDTPPPRCLGRIVLRQHEVQDVLRLLNNNNFTRNREQRNRSIISNYVFILFFVDRGDVCQFPFIWKMFSYQINVKNSTQWFRNNIVSHF